MIEWLETHRHISRRNAKYWRMMPKVICEANNGQNIILTFYFVGEKKILVVACLCVFLGMRFQNYFWVLQCTIHVKLSIENKWNPKKKAKWYQNCFMLPVLTIVSLPEYTILYVSFSRSHFWLDNCFRISKHFVDFVVQLYLFDDIALAYLFHRTWRSVLSIVAMMIYDFLLLPSLSTNQFTKKTFRPLILSAQSSFHCFFCSPMIWDLWCVQKIFAYR